MSLNLSWHSALPSVKLPLCEALIALIPRLPALYETLWYLYVLVFEEGGMLAQTFHNGFGLQTITGVAKPVYRAFELLRDAGDKIAASDVSASVR